MIFFLCSICRKICFCSDWVKIVFSNICGPLVIVSKTFRSAVSFFELQFSSVVVIVTPFHKIRDKEKDVGKQIKYLYFERTLVNIQRNVVAECLWIETKYNRRKKYSFKLSKKYIINVNFISILVLYRITPPSPR